MTPGSSTDGLLRELLSSDGVNELAAIAVAVLVSLLVNRLIRGPLKRIREKRGASSLAEGAIILAPFAAALCLIALAAGFAQTLATPTGILLLSLRLVVALAVVRFAVFLLRLLVGESSWIARWEIRLTVLLWAGLGLELLGGFDWLEQTLDAIDLLPGKSVFSLWALLRGIVVVSGFVIVTSLAARAIERRVMQLKDIAPSTQVGIVKAAYSLLITIGILLGINSAGVDLTSLTVLTGAVVFALGFGIRDITSNFVSGFVLLMDKSIKPGDVISFHQHTGTTSDNFGWVQELRGRYVVVRDRDGVESLVPNQNLITNSVINWSYSDQRVRLRLPVMISYDDDPEVALELLIKATSDHPRILVDPGPVSRLMSFENYGMKLEARFWIRDPMNGVNNVRSDVNRRIWKLFREHGVKIPVAQQEVRVLDPETIETPTLPPGLSRRDASPRG
ncbi:MAG: mechanosensitive ion channel [Gammaproteobacteria bacterium]|nr:mechanosensitive ion channel [Gammaproteobacteria bacterium]